MEINEYLSLIEEAFKSLKEAYNSFGEQLKDAKAQVNGMQNDLNLCK